MPGSARSLLAATGLTAQYSDGTEQDFSSLPTVAFNGTGRRFGGDARKSSKYPKQPQRRKPKTEMLCWECDQPGHFARDRHQPVEIAAALQRQKKENAYVSIHSVSLDIVAATAYSSFSDESPESSGIESAGATGALLLAKAAEI